MFRSTLQIQTHGNAGRIIQHYHVCYKHLLPIILNSVLLQHNRKEIVLSSNDLILDILHFAQLKFLKKNGQMCLRSTQLHLLITELRNEAQKHTQSSVSNYSSCCNVVSQHIVFTVIMASHHYICLTSFIQQNCSISCFWETQPLGCVKISCIFYHSKPRNINGLFLPPSSSEYIL